MIIFLDLHLNAILSIDETKLEKIDSKIEICAERIIIFTKQQNLALYYDYPCYQAWEYIISWWESISMSNLRSILCHSQCSLACLLFFLALARRQNPQMNCIQITDPWTYAMCCGYFIWLTAIRIWSIMSPSCTLSKVISWELLTSSQPNM